MVLLLLTVDSLWRQRFSRKKIGSVASSTIFGRNREKPARRSVSTKLQPRTQSFHSVFLGHDRIFSNHFSIDGAIRSANVAPPTAVGLNEKKEKNNPAGNNVIYGRKIASAGARFRFFFFFGVLQFRTVWVAGRSVVVE